MKLSMYHWGLWPIIVYINHDLGLTLTFYGKVNFGYIGFSMKTKVKKKTDFFFRKFCGL